MLRRTFGSMLVGRQAELEAVRAALEAGPGGGLAAVLVTGEGGIGKSRLLHEVVAELEAQGWHVLAGRADPLERQIPYAVLARTADSVTSDADPEVSGLAAEVAATLDVLGGAVRSEVESSFGQACGQVTRLLRALLERRPVALVLDDLHALDDDALALLAIVLRRLATGRIAFLATSRVGSASSSGPLDALLGRLEADGVLTVVPLGPLDPEAIGAVVESVLGPGADATLVGRVSAGSEGNPFFALEIAASLVESPDAVPLNRRTAILQRFAPLDPDARAVLRVIAALGRVDVDDLDLLGAVAGLSEEAVASVFDRLVAAGLLNRTHDGYAFTHDLVREALYDDVGPAEQRRLHRAIADHWLAARRAGRPIDVLALARHLAEAAQAGDAEAVSVLVEAGDRSRSIAPGSAAAFYGRALDLSPPGRAERAGVLSRRCRALVLAGQPSDAVRSGQLALEVLPPGTPERSRTATAVIASLFELGRLEEALAVADAEVAAGDPGPVVVAQRPMLLWFSGRLDEARAEWRRVRDLPVPSEPERILVLGQLAQGAATFPDQHALLDITAELQALATTAAPTLQLYAVAMAAYLLAMDGCADRALPLVEQAEAMLEDAGGTPFRGNVLVARVVLDWLQGRWDEALEGGASAVRELEGAQLAVHLGAFHAAEIDIRANRGEQVPAGLLEYAPPTANMVGLRAVSVSGLRQSLGDADAARREIETAWESGGDSTSYLPPLLGRLIEIELAAGRAEAAGETLLELEKHAAAMVDPWTGTWLGRSRALVHRDAAAARESVRVADGAGLVFERARSQLVLGELDAGETESVADAYRTFQALGADRHRRMAGALLTERGAKVPRQRSTRAGPLTNAELAIARLVQQGMRNKEIASFLHYSPRTVEVYLSRIYAKLAVSSRLELARALDARAFEG